MRLIDRLVGQTSDTSRSTSWTDWFQFDGSSYPLFGHGSPIQFTQSGEAVVEPDRTLESYAQNILSRHGPVAALVFVRQMVFSSVEFKWQNLSDRRLWGGPGLGPLENPWAGGTTQNLLAKMLVDADVAGNSFWRRDGDELVRLRPDRVEIVLRRREDGTYRKVGYRWWPDGKHIGDDPKTYTADEVVHFMPLQDPVHEWRGMSWITPVIREIMVDKAATTHQLKFMENAATPNLAIKFPEGLTPEQAEEFKRLADEKHAGVNNAWKSMYVGGGADVTVVGTDLSKLDLKSVQGGLESRLASAAGVPPVVVGFREGLSGSSLNAGNYGQARRRFADGTLHPLWREAAGSLQRVVDVPAGSRLWVDTTHVPFLREDAKDEAEIFQTQAAAIRQLLDAGFKADAAVAAARGADVSQLVGQHTGKLSVQLNPMDGVDQEGTDDE